MVNNSERSIVLVVDDDPGSDCSLIVVTARTDLLVRAAEFADAVIAKPFAVEQLLAKIADCFRATLTLPA